LEEQFSSMDIDSQDHEDLQVRNQRQENDLQFNFLGGME
jgi:hypothetical protein